MKPTTHENLPTTDLSKDPTVQNAIDMIKRTLFGASKKDLASKYLVGAKVEEIRTSAANEKYGKKAVATIAREVGLTASCLYQYADVAHTWNQGTFDEAGVRAAKAGLTFSHFVELAHEDHAAHRESLLEKAIGNRLTVRVLRTHRQPRRQGAPAGSAKPAEARRQEPPKVDILERLEREGMTDEVLEGINAELHELRGLETELHRRIEMLEEARERWGEAPAPAESGADLGKAAE